VTIEDAQNTQNTHTKQHNTQKLTERVLAKLSY